MACEIERLADVFHAVPDPRKPRGVRHPAGSVFALAFLGMLARIREMEVLRRWAEEHWDELREPLGFTRDTPPHPTTFSRLLARFTLQELSDAFRQWLQEVILNDEPLIATADGKTACQGHGADGKPIHMLTVFVQRIKVVLGQWSVHGEKTNEPGALKKHLAELLEEYPQLKLITGDAIFAQRPLAEVFVKHKCDYLFQICDNQPDIQDALQQCLGDVDHRPPAAETEEKRGRTPNAVVSGWRWTTPTSSANSSALPVAASLCGSIAK